MPASFSLFHVFPRRAVALLSLSVLLGFFVFPLLWQCRVEARALYRLANCPPLALKDSYLGSYHEKLSFIGSVMYSWPKIRHFLVLG